MSLIGEQKLKITDVSEGFIDMDGDKRLPVTDLDKRAPIFALLFPARGFCCTGKRADYFRLRAVRAYLLTDFRHKVVEQDFQISPTGQLVDPLVRPNHL